MGAKKFGVLKSCMVMDKGKMFGCYLVNIFMRSKSKVLALGRFCLASGLIVISGEQLERGE